MAVDVADIRGTNAPLMTVPLDVDGALVDSDDAHAMPGLPVGQFPPGCIVEALNSTPIVLIGAPLAGTPVHD